jgi:sulfate transport system ATP-binding protein
MSIRVESVTKRFGDFVALDNVSLDVAQGALLALLGPSGCGKTTLLRIIAGLESPDEGRVLLSDTDVTGHNPRQRNMGFVFQHYALFRHMTVFENVAFGLRVRGWKNGAVKQRVEELLQLVRLEGMGRHYPSQLSGGQRQRIALARALAVQPHVLLLDEPFGALDAKVRQELRRWLRRFHDEYKVTSIFVTHDQEEAFEVADRVVVMNSGRIEQAGTPQEIFDHPSNAFVMDFLGNVNVFHGRVHNGKTFVGDMEVHLPELAHMDSGSATVYVRPHELDIAVASDGTPSLPAQIRHINPAGAVIRVSLHAEDFGIDLNVDLSQERYRELGLRTGMLVHVFPRRYRVFVPDYQI